MNFDFLKDVCGLGHVYENCNNAEKLATTMPEQSLITSRKSAELLAKFIYMAAHKQKMSGMSLANILSDETVKKFVSYGNKDILTAFHFIRKSGNRAAHGDDNETGDEAIAVLRSLHYVAGETARMLNLIDDYPVFDERIENFPEAKFVDDEDVELKATKMFLEYVEKYNAFKEKAQYIQMQDYDLEQYSIEGNIEMHEYLQFDVRPKQASLIEFLQNYLETLYRLSVERSEENAEYLEYHDPVSLEVILILDQVEYSSRNEDFLKAVEEKLPTSSSIIIDCKCTGILREFFCEDEEDGNINMSRKDAVWQGAGMLDELETYKRRNDFTYKLAVFYPDSGEFRYEKILNGRDVDVLAAGTTDITNKSFDDEWWSFSLNLGVDFDFEKHNDVLKKLRDIVRERIPKTEIGYCESAWEDGENHILCNGIQWNCRSLAEVQQFLDELNRVLLPIKSEIDAGCDGTWEVKDEFAVATWIWTDEGFKVVGTCY